MVLLSWLSGGSLLLAGKWMVFHGIEHTQAGQKATSWRPSVKLVTMNCISGASRAADAASDHEDCRPVVPNPKCRAGI